MANSQLRKYATVESITSWTDFNKVYESRFCQRDPETEGSIQWIFRGEKGGSWNLKSTLDKELQDFKIDRRKAREIELGLLRKFTRQCHHYTINIPGDGDSLEWLALMRHYGVPVRLLDFTYSFFVAAYFAMRFANTKPKVKKCTIWAINMDWMMHEPLERALKKNTRALAIWKKDPEILKQKTFSTLFGLRKPISFVAAVNPLKFNKRQMIQQGLFLCPGNVSKTFDSNLIALLSPWGYQAKNNFIKIEIDANLRLQKDILFNLQRMNMNDATLFPGLAGFGQSLRTLLIEPSIFLNAGDYKL